MKILVCDDNKVRGKRTLRHIADANVGHETVPLFGPELKEEIAALFKRAADALDGESFFTADNSKFLSDVDIVIIDNKLSDLNIANARHTAESIAGYLRAFGTIPYIVSLNKNPHVDFDLRYLVGDYHTHADLAVNNDHLSNRALWTGDQRDAKDDFLPWYWPALNDAPDRRRRQIQFVGDHLHDSILKSMDFSPSASRHLPRHAKGALSPEATRVTTVTFLKFFVTACRSLPILADRKALAKLASDVQPARQVVQRVAAAEVDRWVRRDLLGPQDLLVDVPHLLMRMPFLLGRNVTEPQSWNHAAMATETPYGLSENVYRTHLQDARFPHDMWVKSPCFWWDRLKSDSELNQMFFEHEEAWARVVFCEDLSFFTSLEDATTGAPLEFAADFEGAWSRRHVKHLRRKHYTPKSRLAK